MTTFDHFAQFLEKIESTPKRLEMTVILAEMFAKLSGTERRIASYLIQGQLVPDYQSLEFQLSTKMVLRALAQLLPTSEQLSIVQDDLFTSEQTQSDTTPALEWVIDRYKKIGDLGLVAEWLKEKNHEQSIPKTAPPTIEQVHAMLMSIAEQSGVGSQENKLAGLVDLLKQVAPLSARYVIRIILGKIRLGASTKTMFDALSWAMVGDKSEAELIEQAFQKRADVGYLAEAYLAIADTAMRHQFLETIPISLGIPIVPALCQRLNSAVEIIEKMSIVIAEPKYDGLRVQIHLKRQTDNTPAILMAYTRNLEDVSLMFPELLTLAETSTAAEVILDAEAIGYDPKTGKLLLFQETITRRRKHDIAAKATDVPIRFYIFDVLYVDGQNLINTPLQQRKHILQHLFSANTIFQQTPFIVSSDPAELKKFHQEQLDAGLEGAVLKQLDSNYQSGRQGWSWVKIKEAEGTTGKLRDTVDCLVMGYYVGRGKRAEFGIGAVLVGVRDQVSDSWVTIAKIGTGLSDDQLRETKKRADELRSEIQPSVYAVPKELFPDIWVNPGFVIEVAADELTKSPLHSAGYALRFPRLIQYRLDKNHEQTTTLLELQHY